MAGTAGWESDWLGARRYKVTATAADTVRRPITGARKDEEAGFLPGLPAALLLPAAAEPAGLLFFLSGVGGCDLAMARGREEQGREKKVFGKETEQEKNFWRQLLNFVIQAKLLRRISRDRLRLRGWFFHHSLRLLKLYQDMFTMGSEFHYKAVKN